MSKYHIDPQYHLTEEEITKLRELGKTNSLLSKCFQFIQNEATCPESYGFEGPETFYGCGKCFICLCKNGLY